MPCHATLATLATVLSHLESSRARQGSKTKKPKLV
jgi:hypothetical protein